MHVPCRYFFPDMTILQVEYYFFRTSGYKQKAALEESLKRASCNLWYASSLSVLHVNDSFHLYFIIWIT